jgi:hypothetical protein
MSATSTTTGRYIDLALYTCVIAFVVVVLGVLGGGLLEQEYLSQVAAVRSGESVNLAPIQFQRLSYGALRLEVVALIEANRWITYEVELRDRQDQVLFSAIKPGWRESGTWREEGESGTWDEADLDAVLELKVTETEPITIRLNLLDYTTTNGTDINEPATLKVTLRRGLDSGMLWWGLLGTGIILVGAFWWGPFGGDRLIHSLSNQDSELVLQALLARGRPLLRLTITLTSTHQSQFHRTLRVRIRSLDGTHTFYTNRHELNLSSNIKRNEDGEVTQARAVQHTFLISPQAMEVALIVEVPDLTLKDRVSVTLEQGVHTRWTVPVQVLT